MNTIDKLVKPVEHPGVTHMDVIREIEQQRNELLKASLCRLIYLERNGADPMTLRDELEFTQLSDIIEDITKEDIDTTLKKYKELSNETT